MFENYRLAGKIKYTRYFIIFSVYALLAHCTLKKKSWIVKTQTTSFKFCEVWTWKIIKKSVKKLLHLFLFYNYFSMYFLINLDEVAQRHLPAQIWRSENLDFYYYGSAKHLKYFHQELKIFRIFFVVPFVIGKIIGYGNRISLFQMKMFCSSYVVICTHHFKIVVSYIFLFSLYFYFFISRGRNGHPW